MEIDSKSKVLSYYDELSSILKNRVNNIKKLNLRNSELTKIKDDFCGEINADISEISKERKILENIVWDRLVIAFFGETNAGKSTIIESLRILLKNYNLQESQTSGIFHKIFSPIAHIFRLLIPSKDGAIVGDGRHDFTKDYHEYNLTYNNKPFTLIDVPGIEGNESEYTDGIKEALSKAHYVFYVHGQNKNIDTGTASKIKEYLADWVKVNVIYNVRANAERYIEFPETRKSFTITKNDYTVIEQVRLSFKQIIGDKFESVTPVQGLLAMCSYANFSFKRRFLKKKQSTLIKIFKTDFNNDKELAREKIKEVSNISAIFDLIDKESENYTRVIQDVNKHKIQSICKNSISGITKLFNNEKDKFDRNITQIKNFKNENINDVNNIAMRAKRAQINKVDELIYQLKVEIHNAIDNDDTQNLDTINDKYSKCLSGELTKVIDEYIRMLSENINKRIKYLKSEVPGINSDFKNINISNVLTFNIDSGKIDDANGIKLKDVGYTGLSIASGAGAGCWLGSIVPGIGNIIGGVVGGVVGFFSGLFSSASKQRRRAKEEADKQIKAKVKELYSQISANNDSLKSKLTDKVKQINAAVDITLNSITQYNTLVETTIVELKRYLNKINSDEI